MKLKHEVEEYDLVSLIPYLRVCFRALKTCKLGAIANGIGLKLACVVLT